MAKATKMVRLAVDETSGVDHPAHLSEGWLVMKSANAEEIEAVIDSLTETTITKEDSVSDESTVVTEDAVVAEAPVAEATETESPAVDKDAKIAELEAELEKAKKMPAFLSPDKMEDETEEEYAKRMKKMEEEKAMGKKPMKMEKSLESVEKAFAVEKARADEAVALLQKERDERADADAVAKAKNWNNLPLEAEKVGPALRRLSQINEDLAKSIEGILDAVNTQAKTSNLFAEIGKAADASTDAYSRLTALAKAAVESGVAPSFEVAMADAAVANADLYKQYLTEKGAK